MARVVLKPKYIGERKDYYIDFSSLMEEGQTIDSASSVISVYCGVDPAPSQMLAATTVSTDQRVRVRLQDGEPGVIYHLAVTAVTDVMEILTLHAYIAALDPDTDVADPECCTRIGNASSDDGQNFIMTNASNPVTDYRNGLPLYVIFDDDQTVLLPTIDVDGLGPKLMVLTESMAVQVLDIVSDDVLELVYDADADSGNGAFIVMNKIQTQYALFAQVDQDSAFSAGTKFEYPGMLSMIVLGVWAAVKAVGSTSSVFDLNADGTSMLSTKVTIDASEKSSRTAGTPPVFSSRTFFSPWILSGDVDSVGTDATGWSILVKFRPLE